MHRFYVMPPQSGATFGSAHSHVIICSTPPAISRNLSDAHQGTSGKCWPGQHRTTQPSSLAACRPQSTSVAQGVSGLLNQTPTNGPPSIPGVTTTGPILLG